MWVLKATLVIAVCNAQAENNMTCLWKLHEPAGIQTLVTALQALVWAKMTDRQTLHPKNTIYAPTPTPATAAADEPTITTIVGSALLAQAFTPLALANLTSWWDSLAADFDTALSIFAITKA